MTAAFLYCEGYRDTISLISSSFCTVNLKGIEGLFSGVSRCCKVCQRCNRKQEGIGRSTDHHERVASDRRCDAERAPLSSLELAQGARSAAIHERYQLRSHCGCGSCWWW